MPDNVVIDFTVKDDEIILALDSLEKLGLVEKDVADQIRKGNLDRAERVKTVNQVNSAEKQSIDINKQVGVTLNQFAETLKNLPNLIAKGAVSEEVKKISSVIETELKASNITLEEFAQSLQDAGIDESNFLDKIAESEAKLDSTSKSLRAQLRGMKEELSLLEEQGKENTQEFQDIAVAAAKLEDQIGDTQQRVRALASDTFVFDGITSGLNGVIGGFTAAQGAAAFFGDENKDLQETLVKLNALIAISTGLAQAKAAIEKQSAFTQLITIGQQKIQIAQTHLDNAATSENIVVKYAAIAAQKALNLASSVGPYGLLAIAVAAVTLAYKFFTDSTEDATEAQLKFNDARKAFLDASKQQETSIKELSESRIRELEQLKTNAQFEQKSRSEIREIEKQIDKERLDAAQKRVENNRNNINTILTDEQTFLSKLETQKDLLVELEKKKAEGATAYYNAVTKQNIPIEKAIELTKNFVEVQTSAYEQAKSALQNYNQVYEQVSTNTTARLKEKLQGDIDDEKAAIQARILLSKAGSDERLKAEIDLIEKEKQITIKALDPSQTNSINLARIEADKAASEKRIEFIKQELTEQIKADEVRLQTVQKDSQSELQLRVDIIEKNKEIELQNTELTEEERKTIISRSEIEISNLKQEFFREEQDRQISFERETLALRIAVVQQGSQQELNFKKQAIDNEIQEEIIHAQRTIFIEEDLQERIKLIRSKGVEEKAKLDRENEEKTITAITNEIIATDKLAIAKLEASKVGVTDPTKIEEINQRIADNERDIFAARELQLEKLKNSGIISYEEYAQKVKELSTDKVNFELSEEERKFEMQKQLEDDALNASFQASQTLLNARFQIDSNRRTSDLNDKIDKLEKQKEAELANKNLTEGGKKAITDKYDKQEAELKLSAWKRQQDADIKQAEINAALAISKVFATVAYPASLIAAALVAVEMAAVIADIKSEDPPKFFKGVEKVPLGKNKPGIDTVPAMLTKDERVVDAQTNEDYFPALSAIHHKRVPAEFANAVLTGDVKYLQEFNIKTTTAPAFEYAPVDYGIHYLRTMPAQHTIEENVLRDMMDFSVNQSIDGMSAKVDSKEVSDIITNTVKDQMDKLYWRNEKILQQLREINDTVGELIDSSPKTNSNRKWQ